MVDALIWEGIVSHIFGPRYLILLRPQFIILTFEIQKPDRFLTALSMENSQSLALLIYPYKPFTFQQQALSSFYSE